MRVLIITYFFPPHNTIGAVRVGKIAKYMNLHGHDLHVVTAYRQMLNGMSLPLTLSMEFPLEKTTYTDWIDISRPFSNLNHNKQAKTHRPGSRNGHLGWLPFAVRGASATIHHWKPDVIYASAMPSVSLLAAHWVAIRNNIPWVAELRDLWVDNPYIHYSKHRKRLEAWLERRVLSSTRGIVTVSEPLVKILQAKYDKPVVEILNGFDPEDYQPASSQDTSKSNCLSILYTGSVYGGKRDPGPLFQALKNLSMFRDSIRVTFYGPDLETIRQAAIRYEVEDVVQVKEPVSYQESLKAQTEADILLLLLWNDPQEAGVYTGKLFEYIGARRPILTIGPEESIATQLIQKYNLGLASNHPAEIANQIRLWLDQKKQGLLQSIPIDATINFSREKQVLKLEKFLQELIS